MEYNFGKILKETRESKGYTLEDIHKFSRIKTEYLDALENEKISELPDTSYGRSFLFTYCKLLEIENIDYIMKCFELLVGNVGDEQESDIETKPKEKSKKQKKRVDKVSISKTSGNKKYLFMFLLLLIVVFVLMYPQIKILFEGLQVDKINNSDNIIIKDNRKKIDNILSLEDIDFANINFNIFRNYSNELTKRAVDNKYESKLPQPSDYVYTKLYQMLYRHWEYGITINLNLKNDIQNEIIIKNIDFNEFLAKIEQKKIYPLENFSKTFSWEFNK